MIEDFIKKEDTIGIVTFWMSRIDFFENAAKMVNSIAKSEDPKTIETFKDTKAYIVGTHKGKHYYSVFFVKKDTPSYQEFEELEGKVDYLLGT